MRVPAAVFLLLLAGCAGHASVGAPQIPPGAGDSAIGSYCWSVVTRRTVPCPPPPTAPEAHPHVQSREVTGTVSVWHDDQGWGVITSPSTRGGIWTGFSDLRVTGLRALEPGERVHLVYQTPGQDGYPHRAVWVEVAPHP